MPPGSQLEVGLGSSKVEGVNKNHLLENSSIGWKESPGGETVALHLAHSVEIPDSE